MTINESGYVATANYGNGAVGLLKLNANGELSDVLDVKQHSGSGTTERQKSPHAHSVWFEVGGNMVISVDLGTNELWFSRIDTVQNKFVTRSPE